jgi:predicted GNAT family acetyltransferase
MRHPATVQVHVTDDHGAFAEAVGPMLRGAPVAHTLMLGALAVLETGSLYGDGPNEFAWVSDEDRVVAAGLSTPPQPLAVSAVDLAAIPPMVQALTNDDLIGVVGAAEAVRACTETLGRPWRVVMEETQYRLEQLRQPRRSVPGYARSATEDDDALLEGWYRQFDEDIGQPDGPDPRRSIEGRRRSGGGFWLWEDGGPRCMVSSTGFLAGVPRIGPIFTARGSRGRGYGQALTADVCGRLLGSGATAVTLFADVANPASNAAYVAVGFEPVGSVVEVSFDRG